MNSIIPKVRPRLIVFDLDETLWPWGVDDFIFKPPYKKQSNGSVHDARGKLMEPFGDSSKILQKLHSEQIEIAAASRTSYPPGAYSLIDLLGWKKYFKYTEIYPGSKKAHFEELKKQSGFTYDQMLFFDNEDRNIIDVSKLGVISILVDTYSGCTLKDLAKGLKMFAEQRG